MKQILKGRRLILGSKSPRRSQLLREMDIPFVVKVSEVAEDYDADMPVEEVAGFLAQLKANALLPRLKDDDIIITADSIVICEGLIYGKPNDKEEAIAYINAISNRIHKVITGVCICDKDHSDVFSEISEVKLGTITKDELIYYIDTYMPIDKAGAYGIQEWYGHTKIEYIHGTYTNIMGLPTKAVYDHLKAFCEGNTIS